MADKPAVIRDTDNEARELARTLLAQARYASIGVIDPETGFPSVSRILVITDKATPVILASRLSAHTQGILNDPRCSLLVGEPAGKGDPLVHPRMTVQCLAQQVERDGEEHASLRERFLERHPKSKLYIDFPDFSFFRLVPQKAALNGGFGKAFWLMPDDLAG
ncbi:HugZ family pyridoxamine 5'-phosphate oxidase [Ectorhizobium quercum]|uniref:HugZ family pyridoxamine 5'-phosphate oxidase n=1 Tax=Ectorhizobium quercum TaxID=2965071 RepID=UPI00279525C3|nr:pyridoxamine 5'-phosphate oxidase family protein [Ectorhizobium quercum]